VRLVERVLHLPAGSTQEEDDAVVVELHVESHDPP
jgi:hypothetical protein